MSITSLLADYCLETRYDSFGAAAHGKAKESIEDCIACMMVGSQEKKIQDFIEYSRECERGGEAVVLGKRDMKLSLPMAAMINAMSAHIRDYDDICVSIFAHTSPSTLAAVLAIAAKTKINGKEALEAYMTGTETAARLGRVFYRHGYPHCLDSTSSIGIFSVTAAAGKLLHLTKGQLVNAFGIAVSEGIGYRENYGTDAKDLTMGRTAEKGIYAAQLASRGFTASAYVFENNGVFEALHLTVAEEEIKEELSRTDSEFLNPGLVKKRYPTCGSMHTAIDAALELVERYDVEAEKVADIICSAHPDIISGNLYPVPASSSEGKFSLNYCIAAAVLYKKVDTELFEGTVPDEKTLKFLPNIIIRETQEFGDNKKSGVRLQIRMKNGEQHETCVWEAKGTRQKPLTETERKDKFINCTKRIMRASDAQWFRESLLQLEDIEDIGRFVEIANSKLQEDSSDLTL